MEITPATNTEIISITDEVNKAKKEFVTDGYTMSIGEIISMYKEGELNLNPDFQREFRWTIKQQSRLIESILIGVPLPSIFVFATKDGKWEVVDGVQRLSTILEFVGELKDEKSGKKAPSQLENTKLLKSLKGMTWEKLPPDLQFAFKRDTRLEVKIIKHFSDKNAKFEVFQRLNHNPTPLAGQEYRNALLIMINKAIFDWVVELSNYPNFKKCIDLHEKWIQQKYHQELVLRLFIFSYYPLKYSTVDEYIDESIFYIEDDSLLKRIEENTFNLQLEKEKFFKVFDLLAKAKGENVFKKSGRGQSLESYFEAIGIGLYMNIDSYQDTEADIEIIRVKVEKIEDSEIPKAPNATTRIPQTIKFGKEYFAKL